MSEGQDEDLELLVHTARLFFAPPSDKQALGVTPFSNPGQDLSIRCDATLRGKLDLWEFWLIVSRAHIYSFLEFRMSRK